MTKKKVVYFVQADGEEDFYAGETLDEAMEFIEAYVAEVTLEDPVELVVSKQSLTQEEIDALPEY